MKKKNIKTVLFTNIDWDTDGKKVKSLPKEVEAKIDFSEGFSVEMEGADYLSDKYGYCIFGFNFKVKK